MKGLVLKSESSHWYGSIGLSMKIRSGWWCRYGFSIQEERKLCSPNTDYVVSDRSEMNLKQMRWSEWDHLESSLKIVLSK
jgi:hypothetical protein